jgi:hypothetical protein
VREQRGRENVWVIYYQILIIPEENIVTIEKHTLKGVT